MSEGKKEKVEKVGGFAFFFSLIFLWVVGAALFRIAITNFDLVQFQKFRWVLVGTVIGVLFAASFIRGRLSVFIHEIKHSVLSNFVGNKAKKMHVEEKTGYFEYSYTQETAPYHAFIALAPYWLPLFLFPTIIITSLLYVYIPHVMLNVILGVAFGMDLLTGVRDIHPQQTDFINLRGGYMVGVFYCGAATLTLCSILIAWSSSPLGGLWGVRDLFIKFFVTFTNLFL